MTTFHELGLARQILANLSELGFETPTPIQAQAIPQLLEGRDLIGLAQTGTGKTAAFGLPIIDALLKQGGKPMPRTARALVLAPTRELVNQIADNLKGYMRKTQLKIVTVVGGASINRQQMQLERGADILVATPGRLIDLTGRNAVRLDSVGFLVLDEADQMLDLGFIHDLRRIAKMVPPQRQTLLFSATMPKAIADLAGSYLTDPVTVEVTPPGKTADRIEQFVHFVTGKNDKTTVLRTALSENPDGRAIVFLRTKHGAEKLAKHLETIGFEVASIHGNKSQAQRERALKAFRDGDVKVLVATDVAARGIDIPAVTHVYNYDLPEVPDAYVHRIGRTARAGREGIAIAFCAPDETGLLKDIEKLTGVEIATASGERPEFLARPSRGKPGGRSAGGRGRGGNGAGAPRGERGEAGASQGRPPRQRNGQPGENARRPRPSRDDAGEGRRSDEARRPAEGRRDGESRRSTDAPRSENARSHAPRGEGPRQERGNGERAARPAAAKDRPARERSERPAKGPRPVRFGGSDARPGGAPRKRSRG